MRGTKFNGEQLICGTELIIARYGGIIHCAFPLMLCLAFFVQDETMSQEALVENTGELQVDPDNSYGVVPEVSLSSGGLSR